MKHPTRFLAVLLGTVLILSIVGCEALMIHTNSQKASDPSTEISDNVAVEGSKYVVTFKLSQSHFTLDIGEHLKDKMNEVEIEIPVDKEYYDNISIGTVINNEFRMGSLIFHGSFGNWKVTVTNKQIVN